MQTHFQSLFYCEEQKSLSKCQNKVNQAFGTEKWLGLGQKIDFLIDVFFLNDIDSISILKSRKSIFPGIYFSKHLKRDKTLSLIFVNICVLKMFLIDIYGLFLFGLVK